MATILSASHGHNSESDPATQLKVDLAAALRMAARYGMIAADDMTSNAEILDAFLQNREIEWLSMKLWPPELEMLKRVALVAGAQGFGSGDLLDPLFGLMEITRALAVGLILEVGGWVLAGVGELGAGGEEAGVVGIGSRERG